MLGQKQKKTLTLPEELEKIEQQITLTLQEIDHNFNKAHRIVTSSIIPVVERYGAESRTVWEGSKFWKQFFEASANVSLDRYEEPTTTFSEDQSTRRHNEVGENTTREQSYYTEEGGDERTQEYYDEEEDVTITGSKERSRKHEGDENFQLEDVLDDESMLDLEQSTPKGQRVTKWADIDSPYQKMKKELMASKEPLTTQKPRAFQDKDDDILGSSPEEPPGLPERLQSYSHAPSTPRRGGGPSHRARPRPNPVTKLEDDDLPFRPPQRGTTQNQDPLLHRVFDKNWRVQATPRGKSQPSRYRNLPSATPQRRGGLFSSHIRTQPAAATSKSTSHPFEDDDDDLFSSPPDSPAPPELQTQIFDSPIRRPARSAVNIPSTIASSATASTIRRFQAGDNPKTPSRHTSSHRPKPPIPHPLSAKKMAYAGGDDDDDELLLSPGFSPPVTIQFSLPQRTILATPARQASKMLVQDILRTAGADESTSTTSNIQEEEEEDEYELDLGEYGGGSSGAAAMAGWRRQGAGVGVGGGGGRRLFQEEEASPTIVRGRGLDLGDETF
ncbi:DASH complex subunit Ask1-domain-containing protein [Kalaharituber pfeilii]|nr:DASH complex subunit Ask1-domain-containing protein [Kalaharituber pfeilii]